MSGVYRWKPNSHVRLDPNKAGAELDRIRTRANGRLTPESVLDAARRIRSPLHDHFEWDDTKAAHSYRVDQAGHLIRSIEIFDAIPDQSRPIRAFVSVVRDDDRSYVSVAHAMSDTELRQQVLDRAWRELESWRDRHEELVEFARIIATIDEARPAK